ncbi:MAG: STAS domain-containing protein [Desulfobacteraceae bacterium]|nr:STAS domain-containing protein [Desulfobacteraceae bacterium]
MEFTVNSSGNEGILMMGGNLTIDRANEIRADLLKSINSVKHLDIKLDKVTDIDLSCLQLLCSAHRTAEKLNKNLTLNINGCEIVRQIVKEAGYSQNRGCALNHGKTCLWT